MTNITLHRIAAFGLVLGICAAPAMAQYKVVGPDGRVTYTDRMPSAEGLKVTQLKRADGDANPASALPTELRQISVRYPVTLYSSVDCAPCEAGRNLLQQRGVPYAEKRIVSEEDAMALERIVGARTVPSLSVGSQALRGLSPAEWTSFLDAAGYPKESKLPKGWQAAPIMPLVAKAEAKAVASNPPPPPLPPAVKSAEAAPGSIRF